MTARLLREGDAARGEDPTPTITNTTDGVAPIDVSTALATWDEPRIPVWLVRVVIAVAGALVGAVGGSIVIVHRGGFSYNGSFWVEIGVMTVVAVAFALAVCFVPWFRDLAAVRWVVSLAIMTVVIATTQDGLRTALIAAGLTIAAIVVLVPLQVGGRLAWARVVGPLVTRLRRPVVAAGAIVLIGLALQLAQATPALAQTDPARCADPPAELTVNGRDVDLTHAVGSNPSPHPEEFDLDADETILEIAARSVDGNPVVVTVELVRTTPIDVVRAPRQLIWHTEVAGEARDSIAISADRDGELDTFTATLGASEATIDMFAGVGTFHVTLLDANADPPVSCIAEVNVRVQGSNWGTDVGRVATVGAILGSAACASVALARPPGRIPPGQCTDVTFTSSAGPATVDSTGCTTLEKGRTYDLAVQLQIAELGENEERTKGLAATDLVRLSEVRGLVTFQPKLSVSPGGSVTAVTPIKLVDGRLDDTLYIHIGSATIPWRIRATEAAASAAANNGGSS